jgi:hypothetical protein
MWIDAPDPSLRVREAGVSASDEWPRDLDPERANRRRLLPARERLHPNGLAKIWNDQVKHARACRSSHAVCVVPERFRNGQRTRHHTAHHSVADPGLGQRRPRRTGSAGTGRRDAASQPVRPPARSCRRRHYGGRHTDIGRWDRPAGRQIAAHRGELVHGRPLEYLPYEGSRAAQDHRDVFW